MAKQDKSELQKAADAVRAAEEHRELCAELVKDAIANCNTAKLELARCEKILDECTDNLYTARNNVTRSIQHVQLITKMGSNSPHGWDQKEVVCGNNTHSLF